MGWNVVKGLANMCGYVLDKSAELLKEDPAERRAQLLEAAFGESVYVANLTFAEIRGWLNRKKSLLRNGGKAVIMKLDDEKFSEIFGNKLALCAAFKRIASEIPEEPHKVTGKIAGISRGGEPADGVILQNAFGAVIYLFGKRFFVYEFRILTENIRPRFVLAARVFTLSVMDDIP